MSGSADHAIGSFIREQVTSDVRRSLSEAGRRDAIVAIKKWYKTSDGRKMPWIAKVRPDVGEDTVISALEDEFNGQVGGINWRSKNVIDVDWVDHGRD